VDRFAVALRMASLSGALFSCFFCQQAQKLVYFAITNLRSVKERDGLRIVHPKMKTVTRYLLFRRYVSHFWWSQWRPLLYQ